jgi:glycosyltransferase involved in cell wall biosynthesis
MSAPRVLVVSPLYHTDRGGLGRQAVLLSERLAELGADMTAATRRMTGLPARDWSPRVEVVQIPAGRPGVHNYERRDLRNLLTSLRFTAGLLRLIERRRHRLDVLHFHGASLPLLGALPWAKLRGLRVIGKVAALHQGVEAGDLSGHYGPLGTLMARSLDRVDAFVATTAEIEQALLAEGYAQARIARVTNFVDLRQFHPATADERERAREALGLSGHTVVLHSGRLTARKGADNLLKAFAPVAADRPQALLLFLGDGPERGALEALARSLGVAGQVRFAGFHEDVRRWLAASDLFVLSSLIEGLPNALLEAMAVGLPILATRIGGSLEAIEEGVSGVLVEPGQAASLARELGPLLDDAERRSALGQAAAERIVARFSLDAIAPRYMELYQRLIRRELPVLPRL